LRIMYIHPSTSSSYLTSSSDFRLLFSSLSLSASFRSAWCMHVYDSVWPLSVVLLFFELSFCVVYHHDDTPLCAISYNIILWPGLHTTT
jgi:hypothetical protein